MAEDVMANPLEKLRSRKVLAGPEEGKEYKSLSPEYLRKVSKRAPAGDPELKSYAKAMVAMEDLKTVIGGPDGGAGPDQQQQEVEQASGSGLFTPLKAKVAEKRNPPGEVHRARVWLTAHWQPILMVLLLLTMLSTAKMGALLGKAMAAAVRTGIQMFGNAVEHFVEALLNEVMGTAADDVEQLVKQVQHAVQGSGGEVHLHVQSKETSPVLVVADRLFTLALGAVFAVVSGLFRRGAAA